MLHALADNIWYRDGPEITFAGAGMGTRMTVVRLQDGNLWVHSPVQLSDEITDELSALGGEVVALIAPNKYHHLYVHEWVARFPEAKVFAERTLQEKVPALGAAETLTDTAPEIYADDLEQLVLTGSRLFHEVVFFHKPSRTLILTDLMINQPVDDVPLLPRLFLRFESVAYPHGGILRLYRWLTTDRKAGRAQFARIEAWQPERLTFCHGPAFDDPAHVVLAREFAYLRR